MEVAWDIMANKCSARRYAPMEIIKVPPEHLAAFREANRVKCEDDELLPSFSPIMEYACLGRTHFTHAQKLGKQGSRTLFNEGKVPIKWQAQDEESEAISKEGPVCVVYDDQLWGDWAAIEGLTSEDNLNSACQMEEDEMTAFMFVHQLVKSDQGSQPTVVKKADVMQKIRDRGFRTFQVADWEAFISLRLLWPPAVAEIFHKCQFASGAGRARVKPGDFASAAFLGRGFQSKLPWAQMSIMLFQYCGSIAQPKTLGPQERQDALCFTGHRLSFAKKLNPTAIAAVNDEIDFLISVEMFIKRIFKHYVQHFDCKPRDADVVQARTNLLVSAGRSVVTVAFHLLSYPFKAGASDEAEKRAKRQSIIDENMANRFSKVETHYRQSLESAGFLSSSNLPEPLHRLELKVGEKEVAAKTESGSQPKAEAEVFYDKSGNVQSTLLEVCSRLRISAQGGPVCLRTPQLYKRPPNQAQPVSAIEAVKVIRFNLPEVTIVITYADKTAEEAMLSADALVPVAEEMAAEEINVYQFKSDGSQPNVPRTDFERSFATYAYVCVEKVLMDAWLAVAAFGEDVQTAIVSEEGKLPLLLQVRVRRAFKKNELMLPPIGGQLVKPTSPANISASANKMHDAYIRGVQGSIFTTTKRQGSAGSAKIAASLQSKVHQISFKLYSPMAVSSLPKNMDTLWFNFSPFWAVLRCGRDPSHKPNMEMHNIVFEVPNSKVIEGMSCGQSPLVLKMQLPMFVNSLPLKAGDVLLASYQGGSASIE